MKRIISINDDMGDILDLALEYYASAKAKGQYLALTGNDLIDAYNACRAHNLRYDRVSNILRDDRLGVLSRPSNPSEWQEATLSEARDWIAREVWCKAVGDFNRRKLS